MLNPMEASAIGEYSPSKQKVGKGGSYVVIIRDADVSLTQSLNHQLTAVNKVTFLLLGWLQVTITRRKE